MFGTFLLTNSVYFTVGALYSYIDLTGRPKFLMKYKIQPGENVPVDRKKFRDGRKRVDRG